LLAKDYFLRGGGSGGLDGVDGVKPLFSVFE
jgi:hypothetical protein